MRKLLIIFVVVSSLLLSGVTHAEYDVTSPGDAIKGVPDDLNWPDAEAPPFMIDDNINTKNLHFGGDILTTGFQVTPSLGGVVTGLAFTTANDSPERDPVSFELYGSNDSIDGPYTLIASGDVVDFSQAVPWPRSTKNETPISFSNTEVYAHYQVLITALRVPANGCCMQVAEVELLVATPPTPWHYKDIGTSGGHAWESGGTYTIRADGYDIWNNNDGLGYVYRPLSGDGMLEVNLESIIVQDLWTKVGVMIRETSSDGSKHAAMSMTGHDEWQFHWRTDTGGGSDSAAGRPGTLPQKLKITRTGDHFIGEAYVVTIPGVLEGYVPIGEIDIPMNTDVLIGLSVCSHNSGVLCKAVYDDPNWPAAPYDKAWEMSPTDGSAKIPVQPTLTWLPGDSAVSHDVYLGTDPGAMALVATKALGDESYTPATPFAEGTILYWQIVEQPGGVAGPVASFKTERTGFGTILREVWEGIGGTLPGDLTSNPAYPGSPTWSDELTSMASYDFADNYGARMQGYLVPENSGDYTFWIAADDGCQLWLSTDEKSCNAELIAYHNAWSGAHEWFRYAEQQSVAIPLVANQKYFIRAIWKEGGGGDNCQVGWFGPDQPNWPSNGDSGAVIDGYYTMSADDGWAGTPSIPDGTTVTVQEAVQPVSWAAGKNAVAHNVYFGSSPDAMTLIATVAMPDTSIVLPPTALGATSYWAVEADNGTQTYPPCGAWSFSTAEWVSMDIATSGGSATQDGDCWTIIADGGDIWDNGDRFHFVYQTPTFTRDQGTITARVISLIQTNEWAKAGVMIRETTASGSKNTSMLTTPETWNQQATFQWREETNLGCGSTADGGVLNPEWVKLVRNGNTFSGYHSEDGINWHHHGDHTVNMNSFVRVGMAATSHTDGVFTTAEICDVSITTPDPRQAWGPSPSDGAENIPMDVTVNWIAGVDAEEHLLYISDNYDDVMYGLVDPIVLPAGTTEYHFGIKNLATVYYWAVDEVRREGRDMVTVLGNIWSFKVENFRLIDDFEAYCVSPEPLPAQELIPGNIILEAVPPADQVWVEPVTIVVDDGPQIVDDPERGLVLALDGDGDYVDCGNPAALNFSTGDWTLSAWVKNTMTGTGDSNKGSIIANGGDGGGGHRYCMIVSEGTEGLVTLVTDDNSSKKEAKGSTLVNDGVWHHVVGIREGDSINIYTDGALELTTGTNAGYDLSGASQANVLIGAITLASDGSKYKTYGGLIDDVQIYDSALTMDNIAFLLGTGGTPPATGPIANWAFEGDFTDSSGNGFDGTPVGALTLDKPGYFGPCIVHYPLDENGGLVANDISGNDLHGAITDAAWTAVTADGSASCLDFNGFGGNILNSAAGPYLNNLSALSISMWVQSDLIDTDKGLFMLGDSASDRWGMRYDAAGGDGGGDDVIKYGVNTSGGNEEDESSALIQTTEWQHIVMTWQSGAGLKLWVNAVLDTPSSDKGPVSGVLTDYTKILVGKGSKDAAADASWDGRIDDVRIYDSVLTEGEIRYLAGVGHVTLPDWYSPLIAHYEFEGDASDSSGNNLHGVLSGNAMIVTDALIGSDVVDVDATDNTFVNCGNSNLFDTLNDQMTVASWIRVRDFGGWWTKMISNGNTSSWRFERFEGSGAVSIPFDGTNNARLIGDIPIDDGQWHHMAAVLNSPAGYSALIIDGKLDAYNTGVSGTCNTNDNEIRIGDHQEWHDRFNGWFDDVRIYNTALSWEQVMTLADCDNTIDTSWTPLGSSVAVSLDYLDPHLGSQSMIIEGNHTVKAQHKTVFRDWSSGNAKALTLYFKGHPDNVVRDMSVLLQTTGTPPSDLFTLPYNGDLANLMSEEWTEWNMDLSEVVGDVVWMAVGFHGSGIIRVDDLRLYPSRCVPSLSSASDLNQDCIVDGKDLRILAGDYLMGDFTITPETPDAAGLLASYQFEGNYDDSSGNDRHGTPVGAGIAIETDPVMGQVLSLPGGDDVYVEVGEVGNSGNMPVSIACWAKTDHTSIPDWTLVFGFSTPGGNCGSHFNIGNIGGPGGVGAHAWCFEATIFSDEEALDWHHYAMAFDGTTIKYFGDGIQFGQTGMDLTIRGDYVNIGKRNTQASSFAGKIDDARIYNYALSWGEVRSIAGLSDLYVPLESIANIYDEEPVNSKKVNLKDYSVLTNDWLEQISWP